MKELSEKTCKPCEGGVMPMTSDEIKTMLTNIEGWQFTNERLTKTWEFKNHYQAIAFVNAVAWISHKENHHPCLTVGYKDVKVEYWTHDIGGISENDFICATKIDLLGAK